jgi:hypothetical protein
VETTARHEAGPLGLGSTRVTCADHPFIGSGEPDWRREATHAGPFGLAGSGRDFSRGSRNPDGIYRTKMPALVEGRLPVRLSIPPAERDRAGIETVITGHPFAAITFVPCPGKPRTIWAAGLALRDRDPITLLVRFEGRTERIEVGRTAGT